MQWQKTDLDFLTLPESEEAAEFLDGLFSFVSCFIFWYWQQKRFATYNSMWVYLCWSQYQVTNSDPNRFFELSFAELANHFFFVYLSSLVRLTCSSFWFCFCFLIFCFCLFYFDCKIYKTNKTNTKRQTWICHIVSRLSYYILFI